MLSATCLSRASSMPSRMRTNMIRRTLIASLSRALASATRITRRPSLTAMPWSTSAMAWGIPTTNAVSRSTHRTRQWHNPVQHFTALRSQTLHVSQRAASAQTCPTATEQLAGSHKRCRLLTQMSQLTLLLKSLVTHQLVIARPALDTAMVSLEDGCRAKSKRTHLLTLCGSSSTISANMTTIPS